MSAAIVPVACVPTRCPCPQMERCLRAQQWRAAPTCSDFTNELRARRGCHWFIDVRGVELLGKAA